MAKKSKPTQVKPAVTKAPAVLGRPSLYKPEYCEMLVKHMSDGSPFETFGLYPGVDATRSTLYRWVDDQPDFRDAKEKGKAASLKYWTTLGRTAAAGQLRRVVREYPMLDQEGRPVLDPNTGQVMYQREYAAATPAQSIWTFMMKNLHGWRDRTELTGDPDSPLFIKPIEGMTDDDVEARYVELQAKALAEAQGKK